MPGPKMGKALRIAVCAIALASSVRAQIYDASRDASMLDDMVQRGAYGAALKLANRDWARPQHDRPYLIPSLAALLIDVGDLPHASEILNAEGKFGDPAVTSVWPAPLARERAALLLAQGEYRKSATEAVRSHQLAERAGNYKIRRAYAASIAAEAFARAGDLNSAREYAGIALSELPKGEKPAQFFEPRVLFTACLVKSYGDPPGDAEPLCLRGLSAAEHFRVLTRDSSLGYLTLAEVRLRAGSLESSRVAANRSFELTKQLFGPAHQDAIRALEVLFALDVKQGMASESRSHAGQALQLATKLFGASSPRVLELTRLGYEPQ